MKDDLLDDWQWCDRLSVVNAAMLAVGLDPARLELVGSDVGHNVRFRQIEDDMGDNSHIPYPRFVPVFQAIRAAVLDGDIAAEFIHPARAIHPASWAAPSEEDDPQVGERNLPSEFVLASARSLSEMHGLPEAHEVILTVEPDWKQTSVRVDDLRAWMERKGRRPTFFFPEPKAEPLDFMDPDHDHFAPELALAVKAWLALASVQKTTGGSLASIKRWIDDHPEEWGGLDCRGTDPKERIAKVVNWNKSGGASKTGG